MFRWEGERFSRLARMVFAMARNDFHRVAALDMNSAQWALQGEDQSAGQEIVHEENPGGENRGQLAAFVSQPMNDDHR